MKRFFKVFFLVVFPIALVFAVLFLLQRFAKIDMGENLFDESEIFI